MRPRLLDLFCGAGGSGVGYHRAGFDVVGVDINPQPRYPFKFIQGDALDVWGMPTFAAVHASPPCQRYSTMTADADKHPDLVGPLRELLVASGLPYVIENVPQAPLVDPVILCGSAFGLRVRRHRAFESNAALIGTECGTTGDRPAKNLLGIPWRVALALQDDGWILRNDIIWAKPNAMPESVTDRLSTKHEHLFLFSKSRRYWFDLDPIREPLTYPEAADWSRVFGGTNKATSLTTGSSERRTGSVYGKAAGTNLQPTGRQHLTSEANGGRNPGDVWTIPTQPFSEAHFAVFPVEIPRRAIAAGCKPGGTVLDPFSGSGTTGLAAAELGRRYVGVDLNRDYLDLSLRTRLAQPSLTTEAAGEL